MAIYRCEFKIISRGSGHRACAAAAYRAGEKIRDERYGDTHDYTRKSGVAASFILAPENAPDWMRNRAELWNAVEAVERRKDAQLCREVLLSLPHELADDQREALVRQFVRDHFVSRGMVADVNIHTHSPSGDERNDHAHILLTTRTLTASSFGPKDRSWNSRDFVHDTREAWAEAQNRTFERHGLDLRVDHRSLADQGIDREPEPKLGQHATESIRNGEPEKADRVVQHHEAVMERNAERERLKNEREVIDLALARLDKSRDQREAAEYADLAVLHAQQMRNLQTAQATSERVLKREQMMTLRAAVRAARYDHDQFRKELTPSFLQRMGEIVTLRGRAMREKRNAVLREFKSTQDGRLNALRAEQRRTLAALKDHQATARDELREAQRSERDDLGDRQQQRFEREQSLLRAAQARAQRAEDILLAREADDQRQMEADEITPLPSQEPPALPEEPDQDVSPVVTPQTRPDAPTEPREGLSGVWDRHAPPEPPESGETDASDGKAGDAARDGGDDDRAGGAGTPPALPQSAPARKDRRAEAEKALAPEKPKREPKPKRQRLRTQPDKDGKTGLFSEGNRKRTAEKNPHFLDPDYKGPSKEELDRARELEKAIRTHKAREARRRADERDRLERDKDRDGPER